MSPSYSRGSKGKTYRYYTSTQLQRGSKARADMEVIQRISAAPLEEQLGKLISRLVPRSSANPLELPRRVEVHRDAVHLTLRREDCAGIQGRLSEDETLFDDATDIDHLRIIAQVRIRNRRGRIEITRGPPPKTSKDPVLIGALRRAHAMTSLDERRIPIIRTSPETQYARRLVRLAFLAPDLQKAIIQGTQPAGLNLDQLIGQPLPIDWDEQRKLFA